MKITLDQVLVGFFIGLFAFYAVSKNFSALKDQS